MKSRLLALILSVSLLSAASATSLIPIWVSPCWTILYGSDGPTRSETLWDVQDYINSQKNKATDEANRVIAEQNAKIAAQNDATAIYNAELARQAAVIAAQNQKPTALTPNDVSTILCDEAKVKMQKDFEETWISYGVQCWSEWTSPTILPPRIYRSFHPNEVTELDKAVSWMYINGLSSYSVADTFLPNNHVTREEASKFFSKFATEILGKSEDTSLDCNFSDISSATPDLQDDIISACRLGIFKWHDGIFDPKSTISMNDTQVVLMRSIVGMLPEDGEHYRDSYRQAWYDMGLFSMRERNQDQDRWGIAIYMYEYAFPEYRNNQNWSTPWIL